MGPQGPQGPAGGIGPIGPPGPATGSVRLTATGVIGADSTVVAAFPTGVGSLVDLPSLTCYQSETGAVWIPVTDILCGLVETVEGDLAVVLVSGTPGWFFFFVAVF